eukprot:gb/GECH01007248.1/.p1 GENE.gb/GECH01007248.1/~~gb/GECH01007248.1/.p1  ORF type:complete len:587 (+),score=137.95 gb/GECH01007248.1/:1-1761(+)
MSHETEWNVFNKPSIDYKYKETNNYSNNLNGNQSYSLPLQESYSSAMLVESLKSENQILREELRQRYNELKQLKSQRASSKHTSGMENTIRSLQKENEKLQERCAERERYYTDMERSMHSVEQTNRSVQERFQVMRQESGEATSRLRNLGQRIMMFQKEIVPSLNEQTKEMIRSASKSMFSGGTGSPGTPHQHPNHSNHNTQSYQSHRKTSPSDTNSSPLLESVQDIEYGFSVLEMVVSAKMETFSRIRHQMKREISSLRTRIRTADTRRSHEDSMAQQASQVFEQEKKELRQEVEELQTLYQQQVASLRSQLQTARSQIGGSHEKTQQLHQHIQSLEEKVQERERTITSLRKEVDDQDEATQRQEREMETERERRRELERELESARLVQQILRDTSEGTGQISSERRHLAQMVERLMKEAEGEKTRRMKAEKELRQYRKEQESKRLSNQVSRREVELVTEDRVPEAELTEKILRQRIGNGWRWNGNGNDDGDDGGDGGDGGGNEGGRNGSPNYQDGIHRSYGDGISPYPNTTTTAMGTTSVSGEGSSWTPDVRRPGNTTATEYSLSHMDNPPRQGVGIAEGRRDV